MILKEYYVLKCKDSNCYLSLDYQTSSYILKDDIDSAYRFNSFLDIEKVLNNNDSILSNILKPIKITIRDNNISEECKDIEVFADKIKNHMMKYCRARIEAQYCAEEVISFIDVLLGIDNKSTRIMDVDQEWENADKNAINKFVNWTQNNHICPDSFNFEEIYERYEKEKGRNFINNKR